MLRNARLFLEDVEKSCAKIILYTEGLTRDQVFNDGLRLDGILFNLQVIGEAVKRLPPICGKDTPRSPGARSPVCATS